MQSLARSVILRYMNNTAARPLFAAQKFDRTGAIHIVSGGRLGNVVTFCTGRSISWMAGTDEDVTCKACVKKADSLGMDLKELGR